MEPKKPLKIALAREKTTDPHQKPRSRNRVETPATSANLARRPGRRRNREHESSPATTGALPATARSKRERDETAPATTGSVRNQNAARLAKGKCNRECEQSSPATSGKMQNQNKNVARLAKGRSNRERINDESPPATTGSVRQNQKVVRPEKKAGRTARDRAEKDEKATENVRPRRAAAQAASTKISELSVRQDRRCRLKAGADVNARK